MSLQSDLQGVFTAAGLDLIIRWEFKRNYEGSKTGIFFQL